LMHNHNMWISLTRRGGPKKPSSRLSVRDLCEILHPYFGEFSFHALEWIEGPRRKGRASQLETPSRYWSGVGWAGSSCVPTWKPPGLRGQPG
jgi:hypothetical protein